MPTHGAYNCDLLFTMDNQRYLMNLQKLPETLASTSISNNSYRIPSPPAAASTATSFAMPPATVTLAPAASMPKTPVGLVCPYCDVILESASELQLHIESIHQVPSTTSSSAGSMNDTNQNHEASPVPPCNQPPAAAAAASSVTTAATAACTEYNPEYPNYTPTRL